MPERPSSFVARWLAAVRDVAIALGVVETLTLLVRVPASRSLRVALLVLPAAVAAVAALALPWAAVAAIRPVKNATVRVALGLAGLAGLGAAMWIDGTAYVRLYGAYHGALGLAAVVSACMARAAFSQGAVKWIPSAVILAMFGAFGSVSLSLRHDARAYAAHRGVLLADAFWATHRRAPSLPPVPRSSFRPQPASPARAGPRPQLVLLVTVDALRADVARAPALNAIVAVRDNAVNFRNARSTAAWTVPSAYSMLTGRGPWSTTWTRTQFFGDRPVPYTGTDDNPRRVWPLPMRDRAPTLAAALHEVGYQSRVCTTTPFQVPRGGLVRGFDVIEQGVYHRRNADLRGTTSDMLTACAIAMIRLAAGAPTFLWLHYADPHEPYVSHPEAPAREDTPLARYAGEVAFVNHHLVGLLLNVDRMVGLGRSLVVLTSDHGEEFREHGGEFHAVTLYDEITHVPLLIASPGIARRNVDASVSLLDLAPTIVDLVGAPALAGAEGRSLVPAMIGEALEPRPVFAESTRYGRAIRMVVDGTWKLIYEARNRTWELYDLRSDPGEQRNVADDHPDVVRRLASQMGLSV